MQLVTTQGKSQQELDDLAAIRASRLFEELKLRDPTVRTQEDAAVRVGWQQGTLSLYLSGQQPIREVALKKLCQLFNCHESDIREEYRDPLAANMRNVLTEGVVLLGKSKNEEIRAWLREANRILEAGATTPVAENLDPAPAQRASRRARKDSAVACG